MRVTFTADVGRFKAEEYALVCGVEGGDKWLIFQRDVEGYDENSGIHLEFSGQANSNYDCVKFCRLEPELLSVDLARQLGGLEGVTGFDVALQLNQEQWSEVRDGLLQVFRDHFDRLVVS